MNRPQTIKNIKSSQKNNNPNPNPNSSSKNVSNHLQTPPRRAEGNKNREKGQEEQEQADKQCPYHFNQPTHICLTCRRSICLRCAITYCQQHTIHPEEEILPLLQVDLEKLTIQPRIEDLELRLKQSEQRQEYIRKKVDKMLQQVEDNFQHLQQMLHKKKQQIVSYFKEQLGDKLTQQYRRYDQQLLQKIQWLKNVLEGTGKHRKIEELDRLAGLIKKEVPNSDTMDRAQLKINKLIGGKDKLKISAIWSQQRLENVLYEIENIVYRMKEGVVGGSQPGSTGGKKKRITTEISDSKNDRYDRYEKPDKIIAPFTTNFNSNSNNNSNNKNPFAGLVNSGSNSRFSSGRKLEH